MLPQMRDNEHLFSVPKFDLDKKDVGNVQKLR